MGLKDILAGLVITYATFTPISVLAQETTQVTETKKEKLTPHAITYLRLADYDTMDLSEESSTKYQFTNLTLSEEDGIVKLCGSVLKQENRKSPAPLNFVIRKKGDDVDIWTHNSTHNRFDRGDWDDFQPLIRDRLNQESLDKLKKKQSIEDILLRIDPEQYKEQTSSIVKAEGYTAFGIMEWYEPGHWALNHKKTLEEHFRFHTHRLNKRLTQGVCLGRDETKLNFEYQRFFDRYNFKVEFYTLEENHILHLHHFLADIKGTYFIRRPDKKTEFRGWIPQQLKKKKDWSRYLNIHIVFDQDGNIESNTLTTKEKDKKITLDKPLSESAARIIYRIGVPVLNKCVKALE